ncbi:MAG: hypothetical protein KAS32_04810, partial [Candidatus Peribacteraceae bacterium]|nr:hypothetical protein [Candidatus Peribacteraceae bacterium]
ADPVSPNAHQGSPSKRHNAAIEREREKNIARAERHIKLAQFIGAYIENNTDTSRCLVNLIYSAIGKFEHEQD